MCNLLSQRAHPLCPDIIKHACFVYVIYSIMLQLYPVMLKELRLFAVRQGDFDSVRLVILQGVVLDGHMSW
jgi:hypothetical protein